MLVELVERRMVEDISKYLGKFTGSRMEPPSFIVTPEELLSYIHLPVGARTEPLKSVTWGMSMRGHKRGIIAGEGDDSTAPDGANAKLVRLAEVPKTEELLQEGEIQPLAQLSSNTENFRNNLQQQEGRYFTFFRRNG
jgi:hypothetical protein